MAASIKHHLLTLPPEIREEIYRLILHPDANRVYDDDEYTSYNFTPALVLFRLNRQIYNESRKIFYDLNTFVKIGSPWPESVDYVAHEGHVPVLAKADKAWKFPFDRMTVVIDAPDHVVEWPTQHFVVLLDDLDKFTRMWFYTDLSHPGLNQHLRVTLCLHDPFAGEDESKRVAKSIQRRLLLPFGEVKGLKRTVVIGDPAPDAALVTELHTLQAQPHLSPEHCLRECTRLKLEGNAELNAGRYHAALQLYTQAWAAIHVVVKGRKRHIHADALFSRELHEEPFRGKNGQSERLMLRVQLVANTCQAYLKLRQFHDCKFWGNRTIALWREGIGLHDNQDIAPQDEAIVGFPGSDQMGKIYYRTAVAHKELGEESEARKLLMVAKLYLPRDKHVKDAVESLALRIG